MIFYECDKNDSNNNISIDRIVYCILLLIASIIITVIEMANCYYVISVDGNQDGKKDN